VININLRLMLAVFAGLVFGGLISGLAVYHFTARASTVLHPLAPSSGLTIVIDRKIADVVNPRELQASLSRIFVKPINITTADLDYHSALNPRRNQYWAPRMLEDFSTKLPDKVSDFRVFVVGDDIYDEPYNFLYMYTQAENRLGVLSLGRLLYFENGFSEQRKIDIASQRIIKLFMKSVARVSGLYESDGCVMRFPHGMDELDATPPEYCADDAERLRAAGVIRRAEPTK
jgi:predicted Zn-dependent protease